MTASNGLLLEMHTINMLKAMKFSLDHSCKSVMQLLRLKPGLQIVVTIADVCDYVSKRMLCLSIYQLKVFPVEHQCLQSLQRYGDQPIPGGPERKQF